MRSKYSVTFLSCTSDLNQVEKNKKKLKWRKSSLQNLIWQQKGEINMLNWDL